MTIPQNFATLDMQFSIDLPPWAIAELDQLPTHLPTLEERMAAVIKFSRLNFQHHTGGRLPPVSLSAIQAGWW